MCLLFVLFFSAGHPSAGARGALGSQLLGAGAAGGESADPGAARASPPRNASRNVSRLRGLAVAALAFFFFFFGVGLKETWGGFL